MLLLWLSNDIVCHIFTTYRLIPWLSKSIRKICIQSKIYNKEKECYNKEKECYNNNLIAKFLGRFPYEKYFYFLSNFDIIAKFKLSYVPMKERSRERCLSCNSILYMMNYCDLIDTRLITKDFTLEGIELHKDFIYGLFESQYSHLSDEEVCMKAILKNPKSLKNIAFDLRFKELCMEAFGLSPSCIIYIPL